jgi:hypothetical protein
MTDTRNDYLTDDTPTKRRVFWALLIFGVSMPVIFFAVLNFSDVPLRISEETTIITEPFFPNSQRLDYYAVLQGRFAPADPRKNGFRMVVQAVGSEPFECGRGFAWESICQQLGLNPLDPPTMPEYGKAVAILKQLHNDPSTKYYRQYQEDCAKNLWTPEQYSKMDEFINEISPLLDLLGEAVRKESWFVPGVNPAPGINDYGGDVLLPCHGGNWSMLQQLLIRANRSIRDGQFEPAWHDIISAMRMGCFLQDGMYWTQVMPGYYYGSLAFDAAERLLQHLDLSEDQLRQCIEDIKRLPKKTITVEDMAMCHHYWNLGMVDFYANAPLSKRKRLKNNVPKWSNDVLGVNWNLVVRTVNDYHDQKQQIYSQNLPPADMQREIDKIENKFRGRYSCGMIPLVASIDARSKHIALEFCWNFPFVEMERDAKASQARRQLLLIAFALEIEKRKRGQYPATLDFLAERYTPEELTNPFSGGPFEYQPNADGNAYRLFSLEGGQGFEMN